MAVCVRAKEEKEWEQKNWAPEERKGEPCNSQPKIARPFLYLEPGDSETQWEQSDLHPINANWSYPGEPGVAGINLTRPLHVNLRCFTRSLCLGPIGRPTLEAPSANAKLHPVGARATSLNILHKGSCRKGNVSSNMTPLWWGVIRRLALTVRRKDLSTLINFPPLFWNKTASILVICCMHPI